MLTWTCAVSSSSGSATIGLWQVRWADLGSDLPEASSLGRLGLEQERRRKLGLWQVCLEDLASGRQAQAVASHLVCDPNVGLHYQPVRVGERLALKRCVAGHMRKMSIIRGK